VLRRCDGNISQAAESLGPQPRRALSPHRKIWPLRSCAQHAALGRPPGVALLPVLALPALIFAAIFLYQQSIALAPALLLAAACCFTSLLVCRRAD
jgi:hypothetical protein